MLLLFFPPSPGEDPIEVEQPREFQAQPRWGWRKQTKSGSWSAGNYAGGANWMKSIINGSWTPKA